ncbi:hypothetical protein ACE6H2_024180 [Prunus campanulata]
MAIHVGWQPWNQNFLDVQSIFGFGTPKTKLGYFTLKTNMGLHPEITSGYCTLEIKPGCFTLSQGFGFLHPKKNWIQNLSWVCNPQSNAPDGISVLGIKLIH